MTGDQGQVPPPPVMLSRELRERLQLPDRCPGCQESFGYTDDWADLLAKVDRHLNETGCPGAGQG